MREIIIRPGQEYHNMYFSPGGMSLSRQDGAVIAVSEKGRALEFVPVHLPHEWANSMLRAIERQAATAGNSPMDYFLSCPFTAANGSFCVTQEMLQTYNEEINIIEACAYKMGPQIIPDIVNGKIVQVTKQVISIITFGTTVLHVDTSDSKVMLQFEVSREIEEEYEAYDILDIVRMARKTVSKTNFKIGNKIVFPKVRRDSQMTLRVLEFLEQTFIKYEKPRANNW